MKKVWLILLAVVLVFGLVMGCGGGGEETTIETGKFEFEGPFEYTPWGNNLPTLNSADNSLTIEASGSTGFYITFESMGYTLNRTDTLIITYEVEVETELAVLTVKQGSTMTDVNQNTTSWGRGGGREYVLGDATLSNYEVGSKLNASDSAAIVEGTWDAVAKEGTFAVKMSTFNANANAIGFQHNFWCDMGGKNASNSKYKLKFLKIENDASDELLAPVITTQPASARIPIGTPVASITALTVVADDVPEGATRAYQWEKQSGTTWTAISGATNASLAIAALIDNATEVNSYGFRVVVSNVRGSDTASITSSIATIAVFDPSTGTSWADILDMGFFIPIWYEAGIEITAVDDGIQIVRTGGAVQFDVDAVRTLVDVKGTGNNDEHIVRLIVEVTDLDEDGDADEPLETSGQNGTSDRKTYIIYNANNYTAGSDPWIRFTGEVDGTFVVKDIQIATEPGWEGNEGVNESLKSIFEWLDD